MEPHQIEALARRDALKAIDRLADANGQLSRSGDKAAEAMLTHARAMNNVATEIAAARKDAKAYSIMLGIVLVIGGVLCAWMRTRTPAKS